MRTLQHILSGYMQPILTACIGFPFVAALFTIPFLVVNYRKYGGIALMRVIVVYSFILYSMCAFLLTVLPLPSRAEVAAAPAMPILWAPLTDLTGGMIKAGFDLGSPASLMQPALWKKYLTSRAFFQIAANVVMQVPLGFYLRYYFRCSLKKTALIGFLVSLFYELTQLTGLWGIYAHAYRYASTDDLINNTLGAVVGYALTPLLALLLPSREEIDRISYRKGENLTLIRRAFAAVLDLMAVSTAEAVVIQLERVLAGLMQRTVSIPPMLLFLAYFVLIPWLTGGRTPGQAILRLRIVREGDRGRPGVMQLLARNVLLYAVEPLLALLGVMALAGAVLVLAVTEMEWIVRLVLILGASAVLLGVVWFFLRCQLKWNTFPHGRFSGTVCIKEERRVGN